jgi:hypothetical protein
VVQGHRFRERNDESATLILGGLSGIAVKNIEGKGSMILVAWYGIPASGKTHHIREYLRMHGLPETCFYDDIMKGSTVQHFGHCLRLDEIVETLRTSERCVIADVQLSEESFRQGLVETLSALVPGLQIEWHGMDCEPLEVVEICKYNATYRAEIDTKRLLHLDQELADIQGKHRNFCHPLGAKKYIVERAGE